MNLLRKRKKQNDQLKDLLGEQEAELPEEENPMQHVAELKRSPILELVLPKDKTISEKQISLQEMPEKKRKSYRIWGFFRCGTGGWNIDVRFARRICDRSFYRFYRWIERRRT